MTSNATLKARELLFTLGIDEPAQMSLEDLIIYHDGIVREVPLSNCDGRMVMKNGKSIVSLNSNIEFPQKKRFVLAHELGHIEMAQFSRTVKSLTLEINYGTKNCQSKSS